MVSIANEKLEVKFSESGLSKLQLEKDNSSHGLTRQKKGEAEKAMYNPYSTQEQHLAQYQFFFT